MTIIAFIGGLIVGACAMIFIVGLTAPGKAFWYREEEEGKTYWRRQDENENIKNKT